MMRYCVAALWLSALTTIIVAADETRHQNDVVQTENEPELTDEEKRAWQNLHGGWGKRAWQDLNSAWGKRAWQDLNSAWGKRGWNDLNSAWGKRAWNDLNSAWGKRGWNDLNSAWGKRGWNDLNSAWGKRGWNDLNSAWGKRGWNDLNSAWGKRAPERWQNFRGSWGKRASSDLDYIEYEPSVDQMMPLQSAAETADVEKSELEMGAPEKKAWTGVHGAWGKRPAKQPNNAGAYYWKREPGWTNLRGMWGKRSSGQESVRSSPPREEA